MEPIHLTYSEDIIKHSVRRYWRRQIGIALPALTPAMAAFAFYLFAGGNRSWLVGAIATIVILSFAMMVAVYLVNRSRSIAKLKAMGEPTGTLTAGDDHLRLESGAGASELPWSSIKGIHREDKFWLVCLDNGAFFTIPTMGIAEEQIQLLLARLQASGVNID